VDHGAAIVARLVYHLLRDQSVPPMARNFSFLRVEKIIFAAELPSLCCTIVSICGDGVRCESSCVWRGSAPCSLPCRLSRAFDLIRHGTSVCLRLAFAQLGHRRDPGPSAKTGLLYPPEVGTLPTSPLRFRWYPLSLSRRLSHSTESVSLYLQSLSLMLYTSFGVARCLQSSGLTAGSPAAAASSLDMFGRSHGIVL
jgi:hypothetical protein